MSHRMGLALGLGNKWEAFSFKGNDLIYQTDIEDYLACLDGTPPKLESFAKDFDAVTSGVDGRAVCPYPILFAQYCALRWAQTTAKDNDPTLICTINDAFRVFFWRACLTNRYDQGYLTGSVSDLKTLWQFVSSKDNLQRYNDNRSSWWHDYGALLKTKKDGLDLDKPSKDDLVASIKDGSSGALQKALTVLLYSQKPKDLKTGASLSGASRSDVELHHIFPVKWVQKNRSKFRSLLDGPAALVPLSEVSNGEWLDTNPHQQIMKWGLQMSSTCPIDWDTWRGRMESLLVSEYAFKQLISQSTDNVERFIHDRTDTIWRACDELCTTKSS
jgi:hypothetical protein